MRRPLEDVRPIGPFISTKWDDVPGSGKKVLGVAGTPMPNRPKVPMNIIYVLEEGRIVYMDRARSNLQMKVESRYDGVSMKVTRSGSDSSKPFDQQAVVATVYPRSLPIEDSVIHTIEGIIERYSEVSTPLKVGHIIIDQE